MGQRGRPPLHAEEFRCDAVEMVRSLSRPISQIADELGVNRETPRSWVRGPEKDQALEHAGIGLNGLES